MNRREFLTLLRLNRARLPRRAKRVAQQLPTSIERRYFRRIKARMLGDMWALVETHLIPALPALEAQARKNAPRSDATQTGTGGGSTGAGEIFDRMVDEFFEQWTRERFADLVQPFGTQLANFQAHQLNKVLEQLVAVDVVGNEPWLKDKIAAFTQQNVALIKTIPSIFFDEIEKMVTDRIATGERWEGLTDDLQQRYGVSESRAKLIARDQSTKFYGNLNKTRQEELGIGGYHWRTMRDNRVRDDHEKLAGKRFEWDKPPAEGFPGHPIQCRCYADPDLQPMIDEARRETGLVSEQEAAKFEQPRVPRARTPRAPKPAAPRVEPWQSVQQASEALAEQRIDAIRKAVDDTALAISEAEAREVAVKAELDELKVQQAASDARRKELSAAYYLAEKSGDRERAKAAEKELERFYDDPARTGLMDRERELYKRFGDASGKVSEAKYAHATAKSKAGSKLTDYETTKAEGQGPVRGPAGAAVARDFPRVAQILGGKLYVDEWTEGARELVEQLDKLPPEFLAAIKPHLGQFTIAKGTIKDRGRFINLSDSQRMQATSYDPRTSYDQVGGIAGPLGGTGRIEVVIPDWKGNGGVVAHELGHVLDGILGGGAGETRADGYLSTQPAFRKLWEGFRKGTDKFGGIADPADKAIGYFTNDDSGDVETFAEALATYLAPQQTPEVMTRIRNLAASTFEGKPDAYVMTAYKFGPKIADYVHDRVTAGRWLKP